MTRWLAGFLVLAWAMGAGAQTPSGQARVIVFADLSLTTTAAATALAGVPSTGNATRITCARRVTTITGAAATLKAYVQASFDDGLTWTDFLPFTDATAAGTQYLTANTASSIPTTGVVLADFTATGGTALPFAAWSQLRLKYSFTGTTPTVAFSVRCTLAG